MKNVINKIPYYSCNFGIIFIYFCKKCFYTTIILYYSSEGGMRLTLLHIMNIPIRYKIMFILIILETSK
jgi:hypothetical protein